MDNRRSFLKKAALIAGGISLWETLPASIQRAMAINPAPGSTYLDAEHIVFLMQENRSFDHALGTLQGVRGFNDPRAITLPGGLPVWLQTNAKGETYCPFRLDMKGTKATWMSSLPHSWESQVDAHHEGRMDKWLDAKKGDYPAIPMTMGYYTREDIPFYYALADAFTVCDQHFCSSLTGTGPNRLHFWTGTIRSEGSAAAPANVRNEEVDYGAWAHWTTFPERLETAGISWKVYQNEIGLDSGLKDEADAWLGNFTDNPLEYFTQYNVQFSPTHIAWLKQAVLDLHAVENKTPEQQKKLAEMIAELQQYTPEAYKALSDQQKSLHERAFTTNSGHPDYRDMDTMTYDDAGVKRPVAVPKGDVLYQFRKDVDEGVLPAVSWLVAPERYSDHPSSAWYGAWYVSEALDILTKNPEVWKKTIFIVTYDENDGCFDHVPPFVAPHPHRADTGKVSKGIDTAPEYVTIEQELKKVTVRHARESPIGLGYRVPFLVASPWSRGGWVNSQVFDHTSSLRFLEHFAQQKWNKTIQETNISAWRRMVCGDLTSVFRPYNGEPIAQPSFLDQRAVIESINKAQFKALPTDYKRLDKASIAQAASFIPRQEQGTRPSSALPYELYTEGQVDKHQPVFVLQMHAGNKSVGAPFNVYAPGNYLQTTLPLNGLVPGSTTPTMLPVKAWSYAVAPGDTLTETFPLSSFEGGNYHLRVYGPNGYFREFRGNADNPELDVACLYTEAEGSSRRSGPSGPSALAGRSRRSGASGSSGASASLTGGISISFQPTGDTLRYDVEVIDQTYHTNNKTFTIEAERQPHGVSPFVLDLDTVNGWYDVTVRIKGYDAFEVRYAGRVETGAHSITDPFMGGTV